MVFVGGALLSYLISLDFLTGSCSSFHSNGWQLDAAFKVAIVYFSRILCLRLSNRAALLQLAGVGIVRTGVSQSPGCWELAKVGQSDVGIGQMI